MLQAVSYQYEKYLWKSINKELGTESFGGFVEVGGDFYRYVQFCYTVVVINIDDANVFAEYLEKCSIYWILDRCTTCVKKVRCQGE